MSEAPDYTISRRARRLWTKFCEWYGTAEISKQFGLVPPRDWCQAIDDIPDRDAMARVLSALRDKHPKYPPKFPEFDALVADCTQVRQSSKGPTAQDRLSAWVLKHKRLTATQLRLPWMYFGRYFDAANVNGKMTQNHGIEVIGVIVPADGDHPGYRVTLEDLQMLEAA